MARMWCLKVLLNLGLITSLQSGLALAQGLSPPVETTTLEKITGEYRVVRIIKSSDYSFQIVFEAATNGAEKFRHLSLQSDHVHIGLQEGQVLKLSAEVALVKNKPVEITQVLLFLPSTGFGTVPIWMLSSRFGLQSIHGARWMEMHAPQSDFMIF